MTQCCIKNQEQVSRKVFNVLMNKRKLPFVRNKIRSKIFEVLGKQKTPFEEMTSDELDQVAQDLEVAPVELRRVRASMVMALQEALTVEVLNPDGKTCRSFVNICFSGPRISTSFRSYASAQLLKNKKHPIYSSFLEGLFTPSHHSYDVCIHLKWENEDRPTASIYHVSKSSDSWFLDLVVSIANDLVDILNVEVQSHV